MYGYVVPCKDCMRASDFVLYRSFYCGMCCQIGKLYGQLPRMTTNYDFAFLSALLHDCSSADIVIEEHKCVLNPIRKKAVLQPSPLHERIAAANILLTYQKALDGIKDGDGLKYKLVKRMLKKPFKKAKASCPEVWEEIERYSRIQDKTESDNVSSIDRAADPFANLLRVLPALIMGRKTDDKLEGLCYNIGKFVYLADALDDIEDDRKGKRYNPFLAAYGADFKDRQSFIEAHADDFNFIFESVCARAEQCFYSLRLTQSASLLKNIVCDGLKSKTKQLLASTKKLRPPRI